MRLTVIDGYNLLFRTQAGPPQVSLQDSREEFLRRVDAARFPNQSVIVVFDGPARAGSRRLDPAGLRVLYARSPRSADDAIVSLVGRRAKGQVVVLTHDRELGRRVRRAGGVLGDPEEFFRRPRPRSSPSPRSSASEKPPAPSPEEIEGWERLFEEKRRPDEESPAD